jgi:hypothetical protein
VQRRAGAAIPVNRLEQQLAEIFSPGTAKLVRDKILRRADILLGKTGRLESDIKLIV